MLKSILLFFIFHGDYPIEKDTCDPAMPNTQALFLLERSKDANRILYQLNKNENGKVDESDPIVPIWKKWEEGGVISPLTTVQNKFAYGLKFLEIRNDTIRFRFVSYKKREFILTKSSDGMHHVYTQWDDHWERVEKIHVVLCGGSFWFPKVPRVELFTYDERHQRSLMHTLII